MGSVLVIACGALAREIVSLKRVNGWEHVTVACLPADLHNRPERIVPAVRAKLEAARGRFVRTFVAYADCGTGGRLDALLEEFSVARLPGAHCYQFLAGCAAFESLAAEEPGSFYLTDFLVRHFDRLVVSGLGLDAHPELAAMYFGNYRRLVYLAQTDDEDLRRRARDAAAKLGLTFEWRHTGYGELETGLKKVVTGAASACSLQVRL